MSDISKINPNGTEYNLKDATARAGIESSKTLKSSVVTVNDAAPINAEDITVDIEPIQDLHGYDRPWAGGAGKNKLPMTVDGIKAVNTDGTWNGNIYTNLNLNVEILTDSDNNVTGLKISGTNGASDIYFILQSSFNWNRALTINGCPSGGSDSTYCLGQSQGAWDYGSGAMRNTTNTNRVAIWIAANYTCPLGGLLFKPMIRDASITDATFAPYSNICPIEGRTGAELDRVGKNKLPMTVSILKSINTTGTWNGNTYNRNGVSCEVLTDESNENVHGIKVTGTASANVWFRITPNTTDVSANTILSGCPASGSGGTYCIRMLQSDDTTLVGDDFGSGLSISSAYNDVNLYIRIASGYACPSGGLTFYPMIRLASETDSTYEPYQGQQYTASFGETVYGGKWHVTEGGTDKTMGYFDITSSNMQSNYLDTTTNQWLAYVNPNNVKPVPNIDTKPNLISNILPTLTPNQLFNTEGNSITVLLDGKIRFTIAGCTTFEQMKTWVDNHPISVCYELATPTTISTPMQNVPMLKGINTVSADCGDVSLKYQPDNVVGELKGRDEAIWDAFKANDWSGIYSAVSSSTYQFVFNLYRRGGLVGISSFNFGSWLTCPVGSGEETLQFPIISKYIPKNKAYFKFRHVSGNGAVVITLQTDGYVVFRWNITVAMTGDEASAGWLLEWNDVQLARDLF